MRWCFKMEIGGLLINVQPAPLVSHLSWLLEQIRLARLQKPTTHTHVSVCMIVCSQQ